MYRTGAEPFARLSKTGGIAGVNETVAVYCDGTIERDGQVITRDAARAEALITQLRDSGVLALPDGTIEPNGQCNDCFLYELELAGEGKPRTLECRGDSRAGRSWHRDRSGKQR